MNTVVKAGLSLFIFTMICVFLVSLTYIQTEPLITQNIAEIRLKRLNELVSGYDNDIIAESYQRSIWLANSTQTIEIYPAKVADQVIAYLIEHTTSGYSGDIVLLTAISPAWQLLGVRAINHKETPGLGDGIDTRKSDWIMQFTGRSLSDADIPWRLKKDGGDFDALTGATITARAVINGAYELLYYLQRYPQTVQ